MDRRQVIWQVGFVTLIASAFFLMTLRTFADPDLWGHLRFGLDMVAARAIITTDPYAYVATHEIWINHEWLTEVLMAGAWLGATTVGLVALRMVVVILTLGLVCLHLIRILHLSFFPTLAVLLLTTLALLGFTITMRPQLFTFLFFTVTLIAIYLAEHGRYRWLWLMPPIIVLWVNLHGGFLAGCGMLGIWTVAHLAVHRNQWRAVAPPILVSALATVVNPYGTDLLIFLMRTATGARPEIVEWQPLALATWYGAVYFTLVVVASASLVFSRQPRRIILLSLFALTALLPLLAVRHLPLMALAFAVFVGEHVDNAWQRRRIGRSWQPSIPPWVLPVPFLVAAIIVASSIIAFRGRIEIPEIFDYPNASTELLATSGLKGNLATHFNWGEYLIWHVGPELKVSIDGRRETVYAPDIYEKNWNFASGRNAWDTLLQEYPTDLALVPTGTPVDNLLRLYPGWLLVYEDATSALFVNQASPIAQSLQRAAAEFVAPPPQRFFP